MSRDNEKRNSSASYWRLQNGPLKPGLSQYTFSGRRWWTPQLLMRLCCYDLLLSGYLTLTPEQMNSFFKLMKERYEAGQTIIITNLAFEHWYDILQTKSMVDALLDRLRHRCRIIPIDGESLRT